MQKKKKKRGGVLILKAKVLVTAHIKSKYDCFCCIFSTADPFGGKLSLVVHHHEPDCLEKRLDFCVQSQGHSKTWNISMNVRPDCIF